MRDDEVHARVRALANVFENAITAGEFAEIAFELPANVNTLLASAASADAAGAAGAESSAGLRAR